MLTANQNVYYTADTTTTTKRTTKPTPETVILANENKIINTKTNNNVVVDVVDIRCSKDKNLNDLYSTTLTTTTTTTATAINKARTVMSHNHGVAVSMLEDGEEQEQVSPEQLDDENENYVIDIGTMQIADESNHTAEATAFITDSNSSDSNNKSNNARQGTPEEDEAKLGKESAMEAEIETSEKREELGINEGTCQTRCDNVETETKTETEAKAKEELDQNYLHEIEISSVDEEQIISELVDASGQGTCAEAKQSNGVRIAFGIILRLMLPLANGVMRGFEGIRDARFLRVLKSVASSRQSLANLMAFAANTISLNLSSVQVSQRIEPILKLLKIRHTRDGVESLPDTPAIEDAPCFPTTDVTPTPPSTPTKPDTLNMPFMPTGLPSEPSSVMPTFSTGKRKPTAPQTPAPKCCTLNVLAEPPPGQPILADIIFIHGLHGSQVNTWRQGLWENERQPEQFERPPKPPVRPPKRPKHTRTAPLHPPHKQKRARFAKCESSQRASVDAMGDDEMKYLDDGFSDATEQELKNSASYACGAPQDIQNCDGIEYSFPTFRLRLNDNGRQLQSATDKMNESFASGATDEPHRSSTKSTEDNSSKPKAATAKLSVDDPNYSKCWPGDWLPLDCPGVRVIALNYTTDPYLWRPLWKKKEPRSNLIERAREMTELLVKHRVGCGRPIVWVGHSKGGLFIKQIMVDAWESGRPAVAPLWRSSRGVFFYSVPHRGSHLACIKAPLLARSVEMLDIEKNNKYLLDLHRRFAGLYHLGHIKIEVFSFVETALTLMSVLYLRIVGVDSADPGFGDVCGIRLDHREICKPRSRECILYKELVKMINKVC
ncbi:uncharacterized protein LOC101455809 isoform X1 [Ceratitis capitata]|uniref:uncharacterized protein LOC101455809 isoform X1 n=2 Tax=Ceratitis capitata TaxID=7213 RepID=UPI0003299781|nr:uncharacterized protein LOC101455809 isoform X1 [Ceratitis capitata]XP_020715690.1 uncharacterized protein LOC101455809 isoform X1 [Ceratitis capitata]